MDDATLQNVKELVLAGDCLDDALRREHMQPLRKEQIDLRIVFLERGEAAGVPLNVICGAQAVSAGSDMSFRGCCSSGGGLARKAFSKVVSADFLFFRECVIGATLVR